LCLGITNARELLKLPIQLAISVLLISTLPLLGGVGADALASELEDGCVVNQTVGRGHGGHRIFENLVPLGEDQIGGGEV